MFQLSKIDPKYRGALFVGFDTNKNSTGMAVLTEDGKLLYSDLYTDCKDIPYGSLKVLSEYNLYFYRVFKSLYRYRNRLYIAFEQPFVIPKRNVLSVTLAQIIGIGLAKGLLFLSEARIFVFNNRTVKKFITGRGNAKKKEVVREIREAYPSLSSDKKGESDRADSIALALMCIKVVKGLKFI